MPTEQTTSTAVAVAVLRGMHRLRHAEPWVLDDPFALPLVGSAAESVQAHLEASYEPWLLDGLIADMVGRTRYAEERLHADRFEQYLVLGAGLDSFVFRQPAFAHELDVIEVDLAAIQEQKRARIDELGWPLADRHRFVAIDLRQADLLASLRAAHVDPQRPTLVSWLGVTQYLERDAVMDTLKAVAQFGPGSEIVFSYQSAEQLQDSNPVPARTASQGEPFRTKFTADEAAELVDAAGLRMIEHLHSADLTARYFAQRSDDLAPVPWLRLVAAATGSGD